MTPRARRAAPTRHREAGRARAARSSEPQEREGRGVCCLVCCLVARCHGDRVSVERKTSLRLTRPQRHATIPDGPGGASPAMQRQGRAPRERGRPATPIRGNYRDAPAGGRGAGRARRAVAGLRRAGRAADVGERHAALAGGVGRALTFGEGKACTSTTPWSRSSISRSCLACAATLSQTRVPRARGGGQLGAPSMAATRLRSARFRRAARLSSARPAQGELGSRPRALGRGVGRGTIGRTRSGPRRST